MTKRTKLDTTAWVAENLRSEERVLGVTVLTDQIIQVSRIKHGPYVAGIISEKRVEVNCIKQLVESDLCVEIIANVPKESFWTGDAIRFARSQNVSTGSLGDLYRVISEQDVRRFRSPETEFIERSMRQHDRIAQFQQIHDRLYRIERSDGLSDVTVLMLNEYDLTADHVRTARDRYGAFSLLVMTNPNGSATESAEQVAASMGVDILMWKNFLGRLKR